MLLGLFTVTLLAVNVLSVQAAKTGLPLTRIGERYYYFEKNAKNWYEAEKNCRQFGLALVALETKTKSDLIFSYLKTQGFNSDHWIWTGATDAAKENRWVWSQTAKPLNYTAWRSDGQPDNWQNEEHCMQAINNNNVGFEWNDISCSYSGQSVCELPLACWLS